MLNPAHFILLPNYLPTSKPVDCAATPQARVGNCHPWDRAMVVRVLTSVGFGRGTVLRFAFANKRSSRSKKWDDGGAKRGEHDEWT